MSKIKLSSEEQVFHMKNNKGISFNIVNENEAKRFLENNNYYFKIKSYAKNYDMYIEGENKGKYINLEFAYLEELSKLDMYIRKFIIKISLDIEHFAKAKLMRDISQNPFEDGYSIVKEFLLQFPFIVLLRK